MQTRAAIDSLYRNCGGEGGMPRRYAPRPPLRSGPPSPKRSGVISPALYTQITHLKLSCPSARIYILAERVGFEPTNTVRCYTLSRRAPSTARPPLHKPLLKLHTGWDCSRLRRESSASRRTDAFALPQIARARFVRTHEHG